MRIDTLPNSPAGRRARAVFERMRTGEQPQADDYVMSLDDQSELMKVAHVAVANLFALNLDVVVQTSEPYETAFVIVLPGKVSLRYACTVEDVSPHRILTETFEQTQTPELPGDFVVERDGRQVYLHDFGGEGPLVLLWHGLGSSASRWSGFADLIGGVRLIAQDMPGHGRSPIPAFTIDDTLADADAAVADLNLGAPIVVGHSMGGAPALRFAATRPCAGLVCLDGPVALKIDAGADEMAKQHPAFAQLTAAKEANPAMAAQIDEMIQSQIAVLRELLSVDTAVDFKSRSCPGLVILSTGDMSDAKTEFAEHIKTSHPDVRVEWTDRGHSELVLDPAPSLIAEWLRESGLASAASAC